MNMPETQTQPPNPETPEMRLIPTPLLIGAFLALLAVASFLFMFAFMGARATPAASHAAAAVQAYPRIPELALSAKAAIAIDMTTGAILYEKNPDTQLPLASITKVALVIAVAEVLPLDSIVTIPFDTAPPGSAQRLAAGDRWALKDVINFTLVASSNKGSDIIASAADEALRLKYPDAPEGGAALYRMNALAKELSLGQTYFINVHGLDASEMQPGAYGSARDMAALFAYAASTSPHVFAATATEGLLLVSEEGSTTSAFNTNDALGQIPGLIMGKTGFTDLSGGNLAVVFDVGLNRPVVAVILGSTYEGRFSDMKTLVAAVRTAIVEGGR